uniref:Uncharacterized protein n=1 Tax=Haptolina ericina TaxID=156174 RepID=A0A7S3BE17_9EUKA
MAVLLRATGRTKPFVLQHTIKQLCQYLNLTSLPSFAYALAAAEAAGVDVAPSMRAGGGITSAVVSLDPRLPAAAASRAALEIDAMLRDSRAPLARGKEGSGDEGADDSGAVDGGDLGPSQFRSSLYALGVVPRLCTMLMNGGKKPPVSLRAALPAHTLVGVLGALETSVENETEQQALAIACGGLTTTLALLQLVLQAEQGGRSRPFKASTRLGHKEPDLLPNLVLAVGALVQASPESLRATGGVETLLGVIESGPTSEGAVLAMQVLVSAGERPEWRARLIDRSAAGRFPGRGDHDAIAAVQAVRALDKLARPLLAARDVSGTEENDQQMAQAPNA